MKTKYLLQTLACILLLQACKEQGRFEINSDDANPPSPPTFLTYKPLTGGARLFYQVPNDEDLLSINAEYKTANGELVRFSASYFVDSLDVYGFADTLQYTIKLYAADRAGLKSKTVDIVVKPLESALSKVSENIEVKPAVRSFIVDWRNELMQSLNIYVDFSFSDNGNSRSFTRVFSSKDSVERRFVTDLDISDQQPVSVKVWIEDQYGNKTAPIDKGQIFVYQDYELPKTEWYLPPAGTVKGGVEMTVANVVEGRIAYLYDGIIHTGDESNYIHTGHRTPWDILIDLGDYYELSRIATWQRRFAGEANKYSKGCLYSGENVGIYNMYRWDDDTNKWELLSQHKIPVPTGLSDLEVIRLHNSTGDVAYMHPDLPRFTKPTRWFRYEAIIGFNSNYSDTNATNISELTLYGKKYNPKK